MPRRKCVWEAGLRTIQKWLVVQSIVDMQQVGILKRTGPGGVSNRPVLTKAEIIYFEGLSITQFDEYLSTSTNYLTKESRSW